MKKLILTFLVAFMFKSFCFGQIPNKMIEKDSIFIKVYINIKGNIYINDEKTSLKKLRIFLEKSELRKAKLATVFPTPMNTFEVVERVSNLFKECNIEAKWYKDPEFTVPAWE